MDFRRDVKGMMMDSRVWNGLPEDMVERVLAFLPMADLLRFRCVCKRWNSLLSTRTPLDLAFGTDSSQLQQQQEQQPGLLCLTAVGSHPHTIHLFNLELSKWNELSLSFLPSEMVDISVVACGGGILYINARVGGHSIHLTCNPLTKTWRELPPRDSNQTVSLGMLSSIATCRDPDLRRGGRYKIIEAGSNGLTDPSTKIFDSATRSWSRSGSLPSEVSGFESEGVVFNGCLYGITCMPSKLLKMGLIDGGEWSEFSAGLPSFAGFPHLVVSMGSLAMVAGFDPCWSEGEDPDPSALKIWKLDESVMGWEEVSTLPEELCEKYLLRRSCGSFDSLKCAAQGAAIYVATYDGSVVLVYDTAEDCWSCLPECPSLADGLSCLEQFFVFNPSLHSSV